MKKIISMVIIFIIILSNFVFAESEPIKVEVNNQELVFDVEPIIIEDLTVVPVRLIFESLALEVIWDQTNRTVTGKNKDNLISLQIDEDNAKVNGNVVKLDTPAVIIDGRTMVPARFIGEATGAKVSWNEDTKTVSIDKALSNDKEYKNSLTYSNLLDEKSQEEVKGAMELAGIPKENINLFFEEVKYYNDVIEGTSLVEKGFTTIDSLEPRYDIVAMDEMWNSKNPMFIGYNCRITTYDLMKDSIQIGKTDTRNADWLVFDKNALEYNPKEVFNQEEKEDFETLYSYIPTDLTKDISIHLENVKEDWKSKEIEFSNKDKSSIISVFFHDEEGYLFIGHMGVLIPIEDEKLLFIEKLSFLEPYQAVKFNNRVELNDYLMNKYDISWGQPTAKPFIMENDQLLEGYREKLSKQENQ
jgi:uncharacterized protein DUF4300/copper amine oxidase-like protein